MLRPGCIAKLYRLYRKFVAPDSSFVGSSYDLVANDKTVNLTHAVGSAASDAEDTFEASAEDAVRNLGSPENASADVWQGERLAAREEISISKEAAREIEQEYRDVDPATRTLSLSSAKWVDQVLDIAEFLGKWSPVIVVGVVFMVGVATNVFSSPEQTVPHDPLPPPPPAFVAHTAEPSRHAAVGHKQGKHHKAQTRVAKSDTTTASTPATASSCLGTRPCLVAYAAPTPQLPRAAAVAAAAAAEPAPANLAAAAQAIALAPSTEARAASVASLPDQAYRPIGATPGSNTTSTRRQAVPSATMLATQARFRQGLVEHDAAMAQAAAETKQIIERVNAEAAAANARAKAVNAQVCNHSFDGDQKSVCRP
jgi:hypothetical protein